MKGEKILWIVVAISSVVGVGIIVAVLFLTGVFLNPKQKVMLALSRSMGGSSIFALASGNSNRVDNGSLMDSLIPNDAINYSELMKNAADNTLVTDFSGTLEDVNIDDDYYDYKDYEGASIHVHRAVNYADQQLNASMSFTNNGTKMTLFETYLDGMRLNITSPELFDGYILCNLDSDVDEINDSSLMEYSDSEVTKEELEQLKNYLWPEDVAQPYNYFLNSDQYDALIDFYNAVEVEKTGETEEFEIGSKDVKCNEYLLTFTIDDVEDLADAYDIDLEDTGDLYDELLEEDNEIYLYLDSSNNLVGVQYETSSMELSISYTGEKNRCDEISIECTSESGNDYTDETREINYKITRSVETDGDERTDDYKISITDGQYVAIKMDAELVYDMSDDTFNGKLIICSDTEKVATITYSGSLETEDNGNTITFSVDKLQITDNDNNESMTFSMKLQIGIDNDEEFEDFDGPKYDILTMDEDDLFELTEEIEENVYNFDIF